MSLTESKPDKPILPSIYIFLLKIFRTDYLRYQEGTKSVRQSYFETLPLNILVPYPRLLYKILILLYKIPKRKLQLTFSSRG